MYDECRFTSISVLFVFSKISFLPLFVPWIYCRLGFSLLFLVVWLILFLLVPHSSLPSPPPEAPSYHTFSHAWLLLSLFLLLLACWVPLTSGKKFLGHCHSSRDRSSPGLGTKLKIQNCHHLFKTLFETCIFCLFLLLATSTNIPPSPRASTTHIHTQLLPTFLWSARFGGGFSVFQQCLGVLYLCDETGRWLPVRSWTFVWFLWEWTMRKLPFLFLFFELFVL